MKNFTSTRNPILPIEYHVPDSEAHVMPDGKVYIYGSFDNREDVYCSEEYHVVSTADMKNWTIYDASMNGNDVAWFRDPNAPKYPGIDWSKPTPFIKKMLEAMMAEGGDNMKEKFEKEDPNPPALLFAPDCLYKDGKYYLYFCMKDDSEGVATSDKPEGPFGNIVRFPIGGIDPAIFIDDDGSAYYYWGQLFSHGVKLNPDMVSFDPAEIKNDLVTEEEHCFHEGSSMRKIGDTYYYLYADMERGKPTSLGYSTSKSPLGPFTYRGIIIDNSECDPASWNNHGSIECVNGQWYIFYHRCMGHTEFHRRLCIEKINVLPDGSIPEVKMTSQGIGDPFGPGEKIYGYQACGLSGEVYIGSDGDVYKPHVEMLTGIAVGDTMTFRYVKSVDGFKGIRIGASGAGEVSLWLNGENCGSVTIASGSGIAETEGSFSVPAGEYELVLKAEKADDLKIYEVTML